MSSKRILLGACCALALGAATETRALAQPAAHHGSTASGSRSSTATQGPHASLELEVQRPKAWLGQAVPITVRAYFRGVEGVTLEGAPTLGSPGVFTSDLAPKPRQATQMIGGAPVLVATWTGTITPSTAAPLSIAAELPVELRYREAAPRVRVESPGDDEDPFEALARNPFDTSAMDRFFQRSMGEELGRVRTERTTLKTASRPLDVDALPTADQPAAFSGAIGHFELHASVSTTNAAASEPVTLRVVVEGDGDLDRVELVGVPTSDAWKAYPSKATVEPAAKGTRARKVFEQVLVPLHGGALIVPEVSLTSFDPDTGKYVTRQSAPIPISVEGSPIAAAATRNALQPGAVSGPTLGPEPSARPGPITIPTTISASKVALGVAPAALLAAAAALFAAARKQREDRALRRAMRKAAAEGDVVPFYHAAHDLIATELANRWGVGRDDVKPEVVRSRLGPAGDALADALATDEALRFGRGSLDSDNLVPFCTSIERSLGGAS